MLKINANKIRAKSVTGVAGINKHRQEILLMIEQDVQDAVKAGNSTCDIQIPTVFNIIGVTDEDAQLLIYSATITELESKGFRVQISSNNIWTISGWDINIDAQHRNELYTFLASRLKKN